ncbi:hypothetical protein RirG_198550 [Rhizophagus irregularis DAOM 197198w]|uniref:Uncharacterized protein n=2 Tax=Rhizophagus irregularis TaxID=588596 RepID=A0A015IVR6_RHIIW|nr:hypothetical protein RirG_198550 [Rhizophagus irregularis DAOM 197198w]
MKSQNNMAKQISKIGNVIKLFTSRRDFLQIFLWNHLIDRKKVSVTADAKNDKVEDVDDKTEEQYKFSSAIESGFPVHETTTGKFTLEDFENELEKATKGCECFVVMTVKRFFGKVNELPQES